MPTDQLRVGNIEPGCDPPHFHLGDRPAVTLEGGMIESDPDSEGCGFGTFFEVLIVTITQPEWLAYRDAAFGP